MQQEIYLIQNEIKKAKNIGLFTHQNGDGDALGSILSLKSVIERMGKNVASFSDTERYPENLYFMNPDASINNKEPFTFDLVIAVDCGDADRLGKYQSYFRACKKSINIDHHTGNPNFAAINYVDTKVGSNCENIFKIITAEQNGAPFTNLTKEECRCLLVGIMTDTGRYKYISTTPETFEITAKLLRMSGINISEISTPIFDENSMLKYAVNRLCFNKTEFFKNNQVALTMLTNEDLQKVGADYTYAKDLSQYILAVKSVRACAIVSEDSQHTFYVSYRSKGNLDVSKCAKTFGGGGHKNASGCRMKGNVETIREKIAKSLRDIV